MARPPESHPSRLPFRPPAHARTQVRAGVVVIPLFFLSLLVGCGSGDESGPVGSGRPPTPVVISSPFEYEFADRVEALGTARAYESVVLTARTSEAVANVFFEDGEFVESGKVLIELERTEETAQLAGARANRADAKLRFDRVADLAKSGTESQSRYDEVRSALDAANARVKELEARISDLRIRAPFSGVIGLREVSPGTLVQPGDRISTLDDIDRIKLDFSVPETFFSMLRPGLEVRTSTAAYPDREFIGSVAAIDTRIDPDTRAVRVRAEVDNADHAIRPGMLLTLVLRANPKRSIALAEQALVPRGSSQFVVVLDDEDRAQHVEIKIGRRVPGIVEVLSGLAVDARVIIDGASLVRPGGVVRVLREETPPSA